MGVAQGEGCCGEGLEAVEGEDFVAANCGESGGGGGAGLGLEAWEHAFVFQS